MYPFFRELLVNTQDNLIVAAAEIYVLHKALTANKIFTLHSSHFWSVKIEFSVICSCQKVAYFEFSHPNTDPAGQGLTSVKFCLGKLSEACGDKEVARELENDQHVSLEANVSRFSFIFFNLPGFSILLVTTPLLRGYLPKTSTMALQ